MEELFVVVFIVKKTNETYVDSVWESEDDAAKYVTKKNEWELSESGDGDTWLWIKSDFHAK